MNLPLEFRCAVKVYSDGTWYCALCNLRGDKEDDPEDYCLKQRQNAAPGK